MCLLNPVKHPAPSSQPLFPTSPYLVKVLERALRLALGEARVAAVKVEVRVGHLRTVEADRLVEVLNDVLVLCFLYLLVRQLLHEVDLGTQVLIMVDNYPDHQA